MAWIIDPNFGSTHYAIDAVAPFTTGGGNRVLRFGSGVTYNDSVSSVSLSMSCQMVARASSAGAFANGNGLGFRSSNGSIYFAYWDFLNFNGSFGTRIAKYHAPSDTITALTGNSFFTGVIVNTSYNIEWRKSLTSLALLINDIPIVSTNDSQFTGLFNPCIIGNCNFSAPVDFNGGYSITEIEGLSTNLI